jgi:hypothetical protein
MQSLFHMSISDPYPSMPPSRYACTRLGVDCMSSMKYGAHERSPRS